MPRITSRGERPSSCFFLLFRFNQVTPSYSTLIGSIILYICLQLSLEDADVFGGETVEGGSREKRLLKLKAIGLGAGLKAAGAGLKAVGAIGAKAVGKVAIKTAAKVGTKVAKAAITLGIAKLLLSVVFGVSKPRGRCFCISRFLLKKT